MVDHGNEGRRTRSRSVPGTSHQAVIDGAQASVTTPASTTPSLKEQSSSSQNCMGNTEPTSFMENGGIIDDLKARIKRAADLNANLKEQARCAEADVRFAIEQRNALQEMLEGYERREQSKSGEILQAKADIQHLEKCLDGCKEQIFKMQPLQHMTDSEIADQYRLLCESISDWTDNHFGDCENSFGRLQECCGEEISGKLIHKYLVQDGQINVVRKYPLAGSTMITFLIHRHLYQSILRENLCYPSLDEKCEDFVSFMENEMRHNEPRRGKCTSNLCSHPY